MQEDDAYFQGHSFGSDEGPNEQFARLLDAKEEEILALQEEVEKVRSQLNEYKNKEVQLYKLIKTLADKIQSKKGDLSSSVRESVRGRQEITLPYTSNSTKNITSSMRGTSPLGRVEHDMNVYGF
mmetsp:Transcript_4826/g.9009  ORF Transcript_4826/g.9009 Transcript_4826/m.9009 type:complete len:125 (-) Transcript_4826:36-410(-)|eukprot:CAMPEP_0204908782 /NCGR_PEP_ID=MMETSP1397-20131031/7662_1 /ASSEMBLY_ACC=CAM_ASM_000891 /TAXON_ID=49980 /ORGANISM="Climacostomum Climacostomum virens, Strain Stock W-24" /LENGTH=124 /DNA_ID=CAMNT_0052078419 /DNA_START=723 /DNA_END=1097 /DNA_ORIENTATION=-